jgi:hypothetical protein
MKKLFLALPIGAARGAMAPRFPKDKIPLVAAR